MLTWGQLKSSVRKDAFPTGEAFNLVKAHDKMFVDAIVDLQQWVTCLQQDNTDLFPQCSTFYRCGITVFDAPRGVITGVSVIDKINPTTRLEDASSPDDWCSEIEYREVDYSLVADFFRRQQLRRYCSIPLFFGLQCSKGRFPIPTDAGLPAGLPSLALGYHYPQTSTDDPKGRATQGIWAKDRGKIYIAPWIQSTETVLVKWNGIKRAWNDADPVDDDPLVSKAILEYVMWRHTERYDKEQADAASERGNYENSRLTLIHQCIEETRARDNGESVVSQGGSARGSAGSLTSLYYNEEQTASATCPDGTTGNPVSVTIDAGTVGSAISVADANQKAQDEAQSQAQARLDCKTQAATYTNDEQRFTASCTAPSDAPAPEGNAVTATVAAGTVTSTISKDDANIQALAMAENQATAQLSCTWWNRAQTATAKCKASDLVTDTETVAAHTYSSTVSQADADRKAKEAATAAATAAVAAKQACIDAGGTGVYMNSQQSVPLTYFCTNCSPPVLFHMTVIVPANKYSGQSLGDANIAAINAGTEYGNEILAQYCASSSSGSLLPNGGVGKGICHTPPSQITMP